MDNTQSQTEIKTKELQQFNYVSDKLHQSMLKNAYQAINLTEMWDYIKKNTNYFMINDDNEIQIISQKMSELGYDTHSGSSFGWTMRHMQFIAQYGLEEHSKKWVEK